MGVPLHPLSRSGPRLGGGVPQLETIPCTCYTVGGMPLAFMQKDFLVWQGSLFLFLQLKLGKSQDAISSGGGGQVLAFLVELL